MRNISLLLYLVLIMSGDCFSQESDKATSAAKVGIYATWLEFNSNTPSITKGFKMELHYHIEQDFLDSFRYTYYCKIEDTTTKITDAFGVYDGSYLYVSINRIHDSIVFSRMPYAGKFPYFVHNTKSNLTFTNPLALAVSAADALTSSPKRTIYYYNGKGKLLEATKQSVGFLIRKENDFSDEFLNEKFINTEILEKYIIKMNLRYPIN